MHAVHAPADPPNQGKMALAAIGCKRNISAELRKIAARSPDPDLLYADEAPETSQAPVQGG
jgi:hypothetical protein